MSAYFFVLNLVFLITLTNIFMCKNLYVGLTTTFLLVFLILFAGTRAGVGFDYDGYLDIFNAVKSGTFPSGVESGFLYFTDLFSKYSEMIFFISLITLSIKFSIIRVFSPLPVFTIFYYVGSSFFLEDMGQIRQSMAISVGLLACSFWFKRSWAPGFFFFIMSCSLHLSCLSFLIVPILIAHPMNKIVSLVSLVTLSPILGLVGFKSIGHNLSEVLTLIMPGLASKYLHYEAIGWSREVPSLIFSFGDVWRMCICLLCLAYWRSFISIRSINKILFSIFLIGTIFQPMLRDVDVAARLVRPFLFFESIIAANFLLLFKGKAQRFIVVCFIFAALLIRSESTLRDSRFSEYKSSLFADSLPTTR